MLKLEIKPRLPEMHVFIPKNKKDYTQWFPKKIKPMHKGFYDAVWFDLVTRCGSLEWDGKNWYPLARYNSDPKTPVLIDAWRGLTRKIK